MNILKKLIAFNLALLPCVLMAAPKVEIQQVVEKDLIIEQNGQQTTQRVAATEIAAGETLFFTLSYQNSGDEIATNVAIDSPVPPGTTYVLGSAAGDGTQILVKVSNDTEYQAADSATVTIKGGETISAQASDISALRWVVKDIPATSTGQVSFQVVVNQ
ncbi:DUF11 domain-containing protein [Thalassotalea sp. ND16A]|uniref:DUF11 domain-containing protein n=1 Tax=Thalassotalea sp. ND16A TaxID=1535422 RepID=UPI00051A18FB|nr:DUF11 domain-containing protein [Thalassotalea sp. ND16A]KGJ97152.1 hypothetical protein ND16A_0074 [Thalassotalea sp. ND16A]